MTVVEAMRTGAAAASLAARGETVRLDDGVPVYANGCAPASLRTLTGLRRMRLKPAAGQRPAAYIYTRWYGDRVGLYDPQAAVKLAPLGSKTKRAMAARRTCPACGAVGRYIVRSDRCADCRERAEAEQRRLQARACWRCGKMRKTPYPKGSRHRCRPCLVAEAAEQRAAAAQRLLRAVTCSAHGCSTVTATEAEIEQWKADNPHRYWSPRACAPCAEAAERRRAQAQREAEERAAAEGEARRREVARLEEWAAELLADDRAVVLDTETTGLEVDARIVEISVITMGGEILLDTLVRPEGEPIPAEATAIHGIGDADVATSPTFAEILPQLRNVLVGRRVCIYNSPYDTARLRFELAHAQLESGWLVEVEFEDVMIPYSDWVGDWNDYWGNYSWQPLGGGHRSLGDCRAVIERLREMKPHAQQQAELVASGTGWAVA